MADADAEELAYYQKLCERLRTCRRAHRDRRIFTRSVATEEQIQAVEAKLGFPLPPLLRMIYLEVADGGPGLIGDGEFDKLDGCMSLNQDQCRQDWRLHPCIERALQHHQFSYVLCGAWPDHFIDIGSYCYSVLLVDAITKWTYTSEFAGVLPPRRKGQRIDLYSLQFCRGALWELCERWLGGNGFSQPYPAFFRTRGILLSHSIVDDELTPELLDPGCTDDPALIWNGLYPGVEPIMRSSYDTGIHPFEELEQKLANYVPPGGWPEE